MFNPAEKRMDGGIVGLAGSYFKIVLSPVLAIYSAPNLSTAKATGPLNVGNED